MAERLAVDGDELGRFMKLLNRSTDSLKGVRKALSAATITGLGTDDLDSACEEFQEDWKYGSEEIGKQTEDLAEIIGKSRDSYREVDKALEEALKQAGNGKRRRTRSDAHAGVEPSPGAPLDAKLRGTIALSPKDSKSSPQIPNPDYPHLGFNPVPGSTETVSGLHKKLAGCAKVLEDTRDLVTKLMDGSYWKGDAAVAFREQLDGGPLPLNLKNAARSIRKAAKQLKLWEGELDDFQRRAKRLDEEAKDARAAVDTAKGKATTAGDDPALDKKRRRARRRPEGPDQREHSRRRGGSRPREDPGQGSAACRRAREAGAAPSGQDPGRDEEAGAA